MKRNISISYRSMCAGIFVIISIIILAINGISLFKYDNATDYEKSALRPGEYVKFQLKDYLSKPLDEYNSDVSSGQCEVEVTFFGDYYVYNIPYMDNTYVRVKVYDKNLEEQLEGKVDLIGKVLPEKDVSMEWYEQVPDFSLSSLKKGICIQEVDCKKYQNMLWLGGIMLCVSVAVLLHDYRVNRATIITEEGRIAHINLPDYDLAYTLEYNLRKYKELEKIQIQNRKKIFWIVLFELTGVWFCINFYYWEIKVIGVVFILCGLKIGWNIFINSDLSGAVRLSELFGLDTVSQRKEHLLSYIHELEKRLSR